MKAFKICKVCGKQYEYCHTLRPNNGFRWQDVACCEAHGMEYFKEVAKSRGEYEEDTTLADKAEETTKKDEPVKAKTSKRK